MVKFYTVAEFRKNIKEALDLAEAGEDVCVDRLGQSFQIVRVRPQEEPEERTKTEQEDTRPIPVVIRELELKRDAELEYVQDGETLSRITKEYQKKIDDLWKQHHSQNS